MVALFGSLSTTDLATAYLSGQTFADVLLGPGEYATGSYANVVFPSGANRTGVLVSNLSATQQALISAAIASWVRDFDPAIADTQGGRVLAWSILGFNLGVECMQLLVVALVVPPLVLLSRAHWYQRLRIAGALFGATAAVAWILERGFAWRTPIPALVETAARAALWLAMGVWVAALVSSRGRMQRG